MIPVVNSIKAIEHLYRTGEEPVLVLCSDMESYICKYMRSSSAAYKLVCEYIGTQMAKSWQIETPDVAFVRIKQEHWCGSFIGLMQCWKILQNVLKIILKMENKLKYSIIYAVIRPEISERLSVGLIIVEGDKVEVRYSRQKLNALQALFSEKEYKFIARVVSSMKKNQTVNSTEAINYLSRYSNNLIAVSPLQTIDIEPTEYSKDRLFKNYVYAGSRKIA